MRANKRSVKDNQAIVIVDDDRDYSCLLEAAFQELQVPNPIAILDDGWAAVNFLKQADASQPIEIPALVLLDVRMPGLGGFEVLRWLRRQQQFQGVPVVVFTGAQQDHEGARAIASGAAAFYVKPFSYRELVRQAAGLRDAYLSAGELKHAA